MVLLHNRIILLLFILLLTAVSGCIQPEPFEPILRSGSADLKDEVYIINSLAETVSIIDCASLTIKNDVFETGLWPNHLVFNNNQGYLVNSGDNNIQVFDEDTLNHLYYIDIGVNSNPWMALFQNNAQIAYVPNFVAGDVAVVDVIQKKVINRIGTGKGPEGCALAGSKLYVGNTAWSYETYDFQQGTVSIIDINSATVIKTILTGKNPQSLIAFPSRNEVHVICTGINSGGGSDDGTINIIDTVSDQIIHTITIGGSPGFWAIDTAYQSVYLAGIGGIQVYNYETREVINGSANYLIPEGDDHFSGITLDTAYNRIFICNFSKDRIIVLDRSTKAVIKEIQGSDGPMFPVFHHDQ
ncbi:MAG: YncE family protein [Spirochaetes bacterium]|nr:YncE family protein [Spirochaetota bacterium]